MMYSLQVLTLLWCCAMFLRTGVCSVVRGFRGRVTTPMSTLQDPLEENGQTEEPERSEFQGWNREQVLNYLAQEPTTPSGIMTQETVKMRRINEIRTHILQTLGITDPLSYSTPKLSEDQEYELISSFNRSRIEMDRSNYSKTFECLAAACEMPEDRSLHIRNNANSKTMQLYFDTYFRDEDKNIAHSVMKLRLKDREDWNCRPRVCPDGERTRLEVRVYQYLRSRRANGRARRLVVDAKVVSEEDGWVVLNIKSAVNRWRQDPSTNFGLEVVVRNTQEQRLDANKVFVGLNCSYNDTNLCDPARTEDEALGVLQALPDVSNNMAPSLHYVKIKKLQQFGEDITTERRKREAMGDVRPCSKYPMKVSLSDLGWDNVTFTPSALDVGICVGRCSSDFDESVECTQCFPTKLRSVFVSYKDARGNSAADEVNDLIVEECGLPNSV